MFLLSLPDRPHRCSTTSGFTTTFACASWAVVVPAFMLLPTSSAWSCGADPLGIAHVGTRCEIFGLSVVIALFPEATFEPGRHAVAVRRARGCRWSDRWEKPALSGDAFLPICITFAAASQQPWRRCWGLGDRGRTSSGFSTSNRRSVFRWLCLRFPANPGINSCTNLTTGVRHAIATTIAGTLTTERFSLRLVY